MTRAEEVSLREYIETLVSQERELREQATTLTAQALQRQAVEYERRLGELNHAHAQALEDRSEFLQRAIYEQTQKDLQGWKLQVTSEMVTTAERLKADQLATATQLATNQRAINWMMAGMMLALALANFLVK